MKVFLTVNYGTSSLLSDWVSNIREQVSDPIIVVVDNFKNNEERSKAKHICTSQDVYFVESTNQGYGNSLNLGIKYCKENFTLKNAVFFAGNMDIKYLNIPYHLPRGEFVYIPKALEGKRNRNPFLTRLQSVALPLHKLTIKLDSVYFLLFVTTIIKLLGYIPSKLWAVHGSLFCFHSECLHESEEIFNSDSFLYSEELEFASYVEKYLCQFVDSDITYQHDAHAATGDVISSKRAFLNMWKPSFLNWIKRWK